MIYVLIYLVIYFDLFRFILIYMIYDMIYADLWWFKLIYFDLFSLHSSIEN